MMQDIELINNLVDKDLVVTKQSKTEFDLSEVRSSKLAEVEPIDKDDKKSVYPELSEKYKYNIYSSDESQAVSGINIINEFSKSLSALRNKLTELGEILKNTDENDNVALTEIDKKSNNIIDEIMNLHSSIDLKIKDYSLNNLTDKMGNFVFQFGYNNKLSEVIINTNIYLSGLKDLKGIDVSSQNYYDKLIDLFNEVNKKENYFSGIKTDLENILLNINKKYEEVLPKSIINSEILSSKEMKYLILKNHENILKSVM